MEEPVGTRYTGVSTAVSLAWVLRLDIHYTLINLGLIGVGYRAGGLYPISIPAEAVEPEWHGHGHGHGEYTVITNVSKSSGH